MGQLPHVARTADVRVSDEQLLSLIVYSVTLSPMVETANSPNGGSEMRERIHVLVALVLVSLFTAGCGCGSRSAISRSTDGNSVFQQGVESGVAIANTHMQTLEGYPREERERLFRENMLPAVYEWLSHAEEFPPGSMGHEMARGQLQGYKSVMGKKYRFPK